METYTYTERERKGKEEREGGRERGGGGKIIEIGNERGYSIANL